MTDCLQGNLKVSTPKQRINGVKEWFPLSVLRCVTGVGIFNLSFKKIMVEEKVSLYAIMEYFSLLRNVGPRIYRPSG